MFCRYYQDIKISSAGSCTCTCTLAFSRPGVWETELFFLLNGIFHNVAVGHLCDETRSRTTPVLDSTVKLSFVPIFTFISSSFQLFSACSASAAVLSCAAHGTEFYGTPDEQDEVFSSRGLQKGCFLASPTWLDPLPLMMSLTAKRLHAQTMCSSFRAREIS